jgi:hypothetical protein
MSDTHVEIDPEYTRPFPGPTPERLRANIEKARRSAWHWWTSGLLTGLALAGVVYAIVEAIR